MAESANSSYTSLPEASEGDYDSSDSIISHQSSVMVSSPVTKKSTNRSRSTRVKKQPAKLKDNYEDLNIATVDISRTALVKCCQDNKRHKVKIADLTREGGESVDPKEMRAGITLMMSYQGSDYPVKFIQFIDKENKEMGQRKDKDNGTRRPKRPLEDHHQQGQPIVRNSRDVATILAKAQEPPTKKTKEDHPPSDFLAEIKEQFTMLYSRVDRMEKTLETILEVVQSNQCQQPSSGNIDKDIKEDSGTMINGVSIMRVNARDAYAFALQILDMLFTKDELAVSLLFKSKKSEKPGLDKDRVEKLLKCLEKRYGNDGWDLKTLVAKVNQKCRDAVVKQENV